MGWFSKDVDGHRRILARAAALVAQYRIGDTKYFELNSVLPEFRSHMGLLLENLLANVEQTSPNEMGDSSVMRGLLEDVTVAEIIYYRRYTEEAQGAMRTKAFDECVEALGQMINQKPWDDRALPSLAELSLGTLQSLLEGTERCLVWFSERPSPRSQKFSAAQAATLVSLAKNILTEKSKKEASTSLPKKRMCAKCNFRNESDAAFCEKCGIAIERVCSNCRVRIKPDAKFCNKCGLAVGA